MAVLLIPFGVLLVVLVSYAMGMNAHTWGKAILGGILAYIHTPQWLADRLVDASIALTKRVTHELGAFAVPAIHLVTRWFTGIGKAWGAILYWSLLWPKELFDAVYWLARVEVPRAIRAAVSDLSKLAHGTVKIVRRVETRVVHVTKLVPVAAKAAATVVVPRVAIPHVKEWEWLHRHWKGVTAAVAGAGAITLPWGDAGWLRRRVGSLDKQLERLNRRTVGLGALALVTAALARMKLGWLRCRNVGKAGRAVCGADQLLVDMLLAELGFVAGAFSLRELTRDLQTITPAVVDSVGYLVREAPSDFHDFEGDILAAARALIPGS